MQPNRQTLTDKPLLIRKFWRFNGQWWGFKSDICLFDDLATIYYVVSPSFLSVDPLPPGQHHLWSGGLIINLLVDSRTRWYSLTPQLMGRVHRAEACKTRTPSVEVVTIPLGRRRVSFVIACLKISSSYSSQGYRKN